MRGSLAPGYQHIRLTVGGSFHTAIRWDGTLTRTTHAQGHVMWCLAKARHFLEVPCVRRGDHEYRLHMARWWIKAARDVRVNPGPCFVPVLP